MSQIPNQTNGGPVVDPGARSVVNVNFDTSNVIKMNESGSRYIKTLDSIISLLGEYCGPFGGYAMILSNDSAGVEFEPNVFTKDGIRILSSMEFMSPMERYLKDLLCYIGKRVDDYAKDGTTTSMMLAAGFLKECLVNPYADRKVQHQKYLNSLERAINILRNTVKDEFTVVLDDMVLEDAPMEEKMKMAGKIAYMQAMSSSGGNVKLAEVLEEVFSNTPPELWDFMTFRHNFREDTELFSMVVDEFDYRLRSVCSMPNTLDKNMGTEYMAEYPYVLVCREGLVDGSFSIHHIETWLKDIPDDKPVVIISTVVESSFINLAKMFNEHRTGKVSLWQYSPESRFSSITLPWELDILNAINDKVSMSGFDNHFGEQNYFEARSVKWVNGYLYIDLGLYDGTTCLHPYLKNINEHPNFNRVYQSLMDCIEQTDLRTEKTSASLGGLYREMMASLIAVRKPVIYLGGPIHDQIANRDVLQDALGAAMSSIKHGFLTNGLLTFASAVDAAKNKVKSDDAEEDALATEFIGHLHNAAMNTLKCVYRFSVDDLAVGKYEYINACGDSQEPLQLQYYISNKHSDYPVLHPVVVYTEFLRRLSEIIVKFTATTNIITTGGVVKKDD